MNPTQSPPRSAEAALLEADYLLRLHEALNHTSKSEAAEIKENVTSHIHAALLDLKTEEVTLTQMAAVLEELGPPETMVSDPVDDFNPGNFTPEDFREESVDVEDSNAPETSVTSTGITEFIDRLFVGYLIVTIGLFIPFVEIYICAIIGFAVIWWNLSKAPTTEIGGAKRWAGIATLSALAMFPAMLLTMMEEILGLLLLPIGIAWAVSDIVLYWIIFGGFANLLEKKRMADLAQSIRSRRIYYILASFAVFLIAIPVGVLMANERNAVESSLIGYAFLPLTWVINWFLILKPLKVIRKALQ